MLNISPSVFIQSPDDMAPLRNLVPGTMYEVMVCRPGFNISDIPPLTRNGATPFIAECGYCTVCYTTEAVFYDFDTTTVTRLNDTHLRLVCDVMSNVPRFFINWSISDPMDVNERMILESGDIVDEQPVSVVNERQGSDGYMSTLIAPESILERDVLCVANSMSYRDQASESGAFELFEGITTSYDNTMNREIFKSLLKIFHSAYNICKHCILVMSIQRIRTFLKQIFCKQNYGMCDFACNLKIACYSVIWLKLYNNV